MKATHERLSLHQDNNSTSKDTDNPEGQVSRNVDLGPERKGFAGVEFKLSP